MNQCSLYCHPSRRITAASARWGKQTIQSKRSALSPASNSGTNGQSTTLAASTTFCQVVVMGNRLLMSVPFFDRKRQYLHLALGSNSRTAVLESSGHMSFDHCLCPVLTSKWKIP